MDARLLVVVGAVGVAAWLQGDLGQANAERRRNDFRYTPDRDVARVLSFGHGSTVADSLWLRALPDFAREFEDKPLKERWLNGVFDVVTDLDPTFYTAYHYGATYLSLINREADSAVALLERGVATFDELEQRDGRQYYAATRLRIDLAMAYWMYKRDRAATIRHLEIAVERPDCDFLTRNMLVGLKLQDRDDVLALSYSAQLLDHQNPQVREKAAEDFEYTKLRIARRTQREFEEQHGRKTESVDELRTAADLDPELAQMVFEHVVLDDDGTLRSPEYDRLKLASTIRSLEMAAEIYRRDLGKWPTIDWFLEPGNPYAISRREIPRGKQFAIDDQGRVSVVDRVP
jgi:hypothetical protein